VPKYWSAWSCKSTSVRDGYALRADTYTGRTSRAGEGVESQDELGDKEPKEPKPALGQNGIALSNKQGESV
jgi:hypothetical protein